MKKYFLSMVLMALFGTAWADDLAIKSAEDWATFCSSPDAYANGSITLDADISVDKAFPAAFTGTFVTQSVWTDWPPRASLRSSAAQVKVQ